MYCNVDAFLRSFGVAKARGGLDLPSEPPTNHRASHKLRRSPQSQHSLIFLVMTAQSYAFRSWCSRKTQHCTESDHFPSNPSKRGVSIAACALSANFMPPTQALTIVAVSRQTGLRHINTCAAVFSCQSS
jgi:hypothetical protein